MKKTDLIRDILEVGKNRYEQGCRISGSYLSRIFSVSRSSIRHVSKLGIRDLSEKEKLDQLHTDHPWYGHRRIGWTLGWSMKKARRLMKRFGIIARQKK
jgi:hypothetical protein